MKLPDSFKENDKEGGDKKVRDRIQDHASKREMNRYESEERKGICETTKGLKKKKL